MLSIITPLHQEPYLKQTIDSLLDNAVGDVEVIPVFDGAKLTEPLREDPRLKPIFIEHRGMRGAINAGVQSSVGKFIMKIDAHCAVAPGYDKTLTEEFEDNWLMIPRRWALDDIKWTINRDGRPPRDYHYLTFPAINDGWYGHTMLGLNWYHYPKQWNADEVGDTMSLQGSCWVANKGYFMKNLFPLNDSPDAYGPFVQECVELGNKYWLGGGSVKVSKKTWYCHFAKRKRHYQSHTFSRIHRSDSQAIKSHNWCASHWMNNKEPNMVHPFSWLVDKFWPVPFWPENWQEVWKEHEKSIGLRPSP